MADNGIRVLETLDLLERYHIPIYLGQEFRDAYLTDSQLAEDLSKHADTETLKVYELAFKQATDVSRQAKILQSFVSNFPRLAWRQADWLLNLWMDLREDKRQDAKRLLRAIARGIAEPEKALTKFERQQRIEGARKMLWDLKRPRLARGDDLKSSLENIQGAFRVDLKDEESRDQVGKTERPRIKQYLTDLACPLSVSDVLKELKRRGVAAALLKVAAATLGVRPRDLASRSPLQEQ